MYEISTTYLHFNAQDKWVQISQTYLQNRIDVSNERELVVCDLVYNKTKILQFTVLKGIVWRYSGETFTA